MLDSIGGIALIGEPGSGKSSIAAELAGLLEWDQLSFAGPLKSDMAMMLARKETANQRCPVDYLTLWGAYLDNMNDPATKDKYRPLLQAYGAYCRAENKDYWLDRTLNAMNADGHYVIDDCRYMNEYDALRARNFQFVYLRPGPTTRSLPIDQAAHESEQDWRSFGVIIDLTYEPGPKHQAERIIHLLQHSETLLALDAESCDCDGDNGNCGGIEGKDDITVLLPAEDDDMGIISVRMSGPYRGEITFKPALGRFSVEYSDDDEPVVAVPV